MYENPTGKYRNVTAFNAGEPFETVRFAMPCVTRFASMALLAALALPVCAQIPRKDVLVCGFPDGSRFILTSRYSYNVLSIIAPIREHERRDPSWEAAYVNEAGHKTSPPSFARYSGTSDSSLRDACLEMGGKRGSVVMARNGFLQKNDDWIDLPPPKNIYLDPVSFPPEVKEAGFKMTILQYALSYPLRDGRLVYEKPLSRNDSGLSYKLRFDGVYQAFSTDNGKTWSDPVITTDALIFQMGKRWIDQCFVARPIEFNGDKIAPDFPEPCPPNP
jgi:hypothetical protein